MGCHEAAIDQTVASKNVEQCERQRRVRAGVRLQMEMGGRRGGGAQRIDDDDATRSLGDPVLL